jgi:hypothetical protein
VAKVSSAASPQQAKPASDVYTVLVIIATAFVLMGTAFLIYRSLDLFGTWLPMGGAGQ